jgi:hypothetical protein
MLSSKRSKRSASVNQVESINNTKAFEQAIRARAGIASGELSNELKLIIDNYKKHREQFKQATAGTREYDYSVMRLKELWKWTTPEGYAHLTAAITTTANRKFNLSLRADDGLFSILNYVGIFHEGEAQASENFYAMIALAHIVLFDTNAPPQADSEREFMWTMNKFKRIFIREEEDSILPKSVEGRFSQPVNIGSDLMLQLKKASTIADYKEFAQKVYDALAHMVRLDLLPRLSGVTEKSFLMLETCANSNSPLPAWAQKLTSMSRRSSSVSLSTTSSDSSLPHSTSSSSVTSSNGDDSYRTRIPSLGLKGGNGVYE